MSYTKCTEKWKKWEHSKHFNCFDRYRFHSFSAKSAACFWMFLAEEDECDRKRRNEIQKRGQTCEGEERKGTACCYHDSASCHWCLFPTSFQLLLTIYSKLAWDTPPGGDLKTVTRTQQNQGGKQLNDIFLIFCSGRNSRTRDFWDQRVMEVIAIIG